MTGADLAGVAPWAVEALVASALLMVLVLVARGPVRRAFGAQAAYALWALPALRLVTPPLPADWREAAATPISAAGEAALVFVIPADAPVAAAEAGVPWGAMFAVAWMLGAAAFFAWHLVGHRRFCRRLLAEARLVDEVAGVRVIESAAARGPLAFGVARRFVAFPQDFAERYDAEERALALAHELGHHARRDLLANWAALAVLALHWFNPLAWRAFHAFRCDQELANDARVLAGRSRTDRHIYACAIVKAAHGGAVSTACHLHTIADLKGRLKMLSTPRPSRRRLAAGSTAVAALVAGGLMLTASGTQAAAGVSERIGETVGVDLRAPLPPVPPVAPDPEPRAVKRITVVKDGRTRTYEGAAADAYAAAHPMPMPPLPPLPSLAPLPPQASLPPVPPMPPMPPVPSVNGEDLSIHISDGRMMHGRTPPEVSERACVDGVDGGPRQFVFNSEKDGRHQIVVCRNRVEATARAGAAAAAQATVIRRQALASALAGLRNARAQIRANADMRAERRAEALNGIDEAMTEVRREMAERD